MGDARGERPNTRAPISPLAVDDDGRVIIPATVRVRDVEVPVDRALDAAVAEHGVEPSFALLLQLIGTHRDALFCTRDEMAGYIARGLLTLDEWSHPDVYGGPVPSESNTFRQFVEVLSSGDVGRYAPSDPPNNRDWKMWRASR